MSFPQSARTIAVRLYRCISYFLSIALAGWGGLERRYQLALANSQIAVSYSMDGQNLSHVSAIIAAGWIQKSRQILAQKHSGRVQLSMSLVA
jgi:hypothetical protein